MFDYIHPNDVPLVRSLLSRIVGEAGLVAEAVYRLRHVDGSWVTVESVGQNLLADSVVRGVIVHTRDVTARQRAEMELRRRAQQHEILARYGQSVLKTRNLNVLLDEATAVVLTTHEADRVVVLELVVPGGRPRGTETILVAEDDVQLRALTRAALEGIGYTVLEAGDGVAALAVAEQHAGSIDLLVTDVVMPNLGGRLLAERLLSRFPTMKVIYASGYTDDMVVRHGVMNAKVQFLQKPFTLRALNELVRQVLDLP